MSTLAPTPLQLDALHEVANVGCAHAANALSRLLGGRPVRIDVPRVVISGREETERLVGGRDSPVVAAWLGLAGGLTGQMMLVLPVVDAHRLCGLLLGTNGADATGPLGPDARSAFGEVANIVASACLTAISTLSKLSLLPTPPRVLEGTTREVLAALVPSDELSAVVLEARFSTDQSPPFSGQMLLVPDAASLDVLLGRLGV